MGEPVTVNPVGGSGTDEGRDSACTPEWLALLIGLVAFDPCSNPRSNIRADVRVIGENGDDGLYGHPGQYRRKKNGQWRVNTCDPDDDGFYNPPYAHGQVMKWIDHWAMVMNTFTFLLRWDPSTAWFKKLIKRCTHVWFPDCRINFDPPPGVTFSSNPFPHALYLRNPPEDRLLRLRSRGIVLEVK